MKMIPPISGQFVVFVGVSDIHDGKVGSDQILRFCYQIWVMRKEYEDKIYFIWSLWKGLRRPRIQRSNAGGHHFDAQAE